MSIYSVYRYIALLIRSSPHFLCFLCFIYILYFFRFASTVVAVCCPNSSVKDYSGESTLPIGGLKLSFKGFSARYDKWFSYDDDCVQPKGSFREAKKTFAKRKKELRAIKAAEVEASRQKEELAKKVGRLLRL